MLSRLEKIGLMSIFTTKIEEAQEYEDRHKKNSEMDDQSKIYRQGQLAEARYYSGLVQGLSTALNEISMIESE